MILAVCLPCKAGFRVKGPDVDALLGPSSALWPDGLSCPHCGKTAQGYLENEVSEAVYAVLEIKDLTAVEAYAALTAGVGLPEDRDCRKEVLEAVVKEIPIRRVVGVDVPNTKRFSIDYLELWDGTRIYFGASGHSAIIYRITRERSRGVSGG